MALLRLAQTRPAALAAMERRFRVESPLLRTTLFGLDFPNRVGLAAGFDKNAVAPGALAALGFGHVEVGTVTPRSQAGRTRPRIFRLLEDDALINRLGFPNDGMAAVARRLPAYHRRRYVLGVNIGPNATSVAAGTATEDYLTAIAALGPAADYLTINVSSPNTQGLRALQAETALDTLLGAVTRQTGQLTPPRPVLLKVAPDLSADQIASMVRVALDHPIAGIVATNTTLARPTDLRSQAKREAGGLSGRPLRDRSTDVVRAVVTHTNGRLPIIAVGGVFTAADAIAKFRAGAALVQVYTGLVYQGPAIARAINLGLLAYLHANGLRSVSDLVGEE